MSTDNHRPVQPTPPLIQAQIDAIAALRTELEEYRLALKNIVAIGDEKGIAIEDKARVSRFIAWAALNKFMKTETTTP